MIKGKKEIDNACAGITHVRKRWLRNGRGRDDEIYVEVDIMLEVGERR